MDLMSLMIRIGADISGAQKGMDEVQDGMEKTEKAGQGLSNTFSKIGGLLKTAFTAVAIKKVADGLTNLVTNAASTADHIDKMSQKIGISREAYQELDFVMSQSGTSVDSLQAGMKTMTAAMDKVREGNKDAAETFKNLGIEVTNSDGTFRSQEEVFFDTVTALQGVSDQTEKSRLATELFGKSGLELMPLLNGAAGSMDEMRKQAHDLGLVMGDDAIDAGVKLTDTIDQMKRSFGAVVTQLGVDLMPIAQTVLEWVVRHMPEIRTFINNAFTVVKQVIDSAVSVITNFLIPAFDDMQKFISETVVPIVTEAWGKLKTTTATVFASIKNFWDNTLKPALDALWKFISETVVPKAETAWNSLKTTVATVFAAVKGYWDTVLKPAFDAIWKFVTETVAPKVIDAWNDIKTKVAVVFASIKTFWDNVLSPVFSAIKIFVVETLGPVFKNTFDGIKDIIDLRLKAIRNLWNNSVKPIYEGIVEFFSGIFSGDMEKAWNGIKELIDGVWNGIKIAAESVWEEAKKWGAMILANFFTFFQSTWDLIKDKVLGVWDNITDKVSQIWEDAKNWGLSIFDNFKTSIRDGWDNIKRWFSELWDEIKAIPQKLVDAALGWGADLIGNFKNGIENAWDGLKQNVSDVGQGIKDFLGFSQPKEGPLSDFDTYAPDMIALFVKGISDSMHEITTIMVKLVSNIKAAFKLAGSGAYDEFNAGLNGQWGNKLTDAIKNPFKDAYNSLQYMSFMRIGWNVKDTFLDGLDGLYDSVKRAFDFSSIYVKTPHFWVTKWNEIAGSYYPEMTVKWYRKAYDNAVMFTRPTVLGTASGAKGFGDGPGAEVVLSESKLRDLVGAGGGTTNNTFNIYQRDGEGMEALARRIEQIMTRNENQRKAAYA